MQVAGIKVAILTVSNSAAAGEQGDQSGSLLHKLVAEAGGAVVRADILPSDRAAIAEWISRAADELDVDLALTSGGAGLSPDDATPEATLSVVDRLVPGIAEATRAAASSSSPGAMLSRGVAGLRGTTLVVNLFGGPRALALQWGAIAPVVSEAISMARGGAA